MHKFSLNTVSNLFSRLWSMLAIYIFIPFYINELGESAYGLVSFFATLQSTLNVLGLGLANTLRREFAAGADNELNSIRKYKLLRSVELLYFGIGIVIVLICSLGSDFISNNWLNIEQLNPNMVSTVIMLMGISIALQLIANLYAGCLFGLEYQVQANMLCVMWSLGKNVGALGVLVLIQPDLRLFYSWHIITDILYLILLRVSVKKRIRIESRGKWKMHDLQNLSTIWKYTVGILFISLVALVNRQLDKVIISKFLSLTELGAYNAATTLGNLTSIVPAAVYTAIFPRFTKAVTTGNREQLIGEFKLTNRIVNIFTSCMIAFIGMFSVPLVRVWTGSEIYAGLLYFVGGLVVFAAGMTELQQIPYSLALAHGNTKINVFVGGIFIPIVAITTVLGIKNNGLVGAGMVYAITAFAQTFVYVFLVYQKYVENPPILYIIKDTIIPLLVALVMAFFCKSIIGEFIKSFILQCALGVISGGVSLIFMFLIFARKDVLNLVSTIKK